jgi:hypothetical protein
VNYFATAVVLLQMCATVQYVRQGLYWEAGLWFSYGIGNTILIVLATKRMT